MKHNTRVAYNVLSNKSSSTNDTPKAVIRQKPKNNNRSIILPPNASENTTETTTNNKHKSVSFPLQESNHEASTVQTDKSFSLTKFEPSENVENSSRRIPEENQQSSNARKPPANHDASKHQTEIEIKRNSKTEPVSDNQKSIEDDQDDFKVNVVRHNSTTEPPPSEDEVSDTEQEEVSKFVSMGYSSQAASIFFGGEEPATFNRPRRVRTILKQIFDGSLSTGLHMGRSNIKQVAQKRFNEISLFVKSLFLCAHEIAHSDLVYTFFHPLLRDQQYSEEYSKKVKDRNDVVQYEAGRLKGQLKLALQYRKGVFTVMVQHARGLPRLPNGQEPSTYVKVYLQPDAPKATKRKTKVVKKNCHPSFMEMLEYRMQLDVIKSRKLQATVWSYDALQENEFMGGIELDLASLGLTEEISEWYSLVNLSR